MATSRLGREISNGSGFICPMTGKGLRLIGAERSTELSLLQGDPRLRENPIPGVLGQTCSNSLHRDAAHSTGSIPAKLTGSIPAKLK